MDLGHIGPYLQVAGFLDEQTVRQLDPTCRVLREVNRSFEGPWYSLGMQKFFGLEMAEDGTFHEILPTQSSGSLPPGFVRRNMDWQRRAGQFNAAMRSFRIPFAGSDIRDVPEADEI